MGKGGSSKHKSGSGGGKQVRQSVLQQRQTRKNPDARKKLHKDAGVLKHLAPLQRRLASRLEGAAADGEMAALAHHAAAAAAVADPAAAAAAERGEADRRDMSRRQYMHKFRQVVESADVVLEVVDARDPNHCRVREAERLVRAAGGRKRLVIVLNKIDLVPRDVLEAWLRYLRDEFPTIAFRASTQRNPTQSTANVRTVDEAFVHGTSECLGGDALLQLLKNYCRTPDGHSRTIAVGVVGYPNVGKSSLINSMKRSRAVGVSSVAGFTKEISEIKLDKHIRLLDSPGVFFTAEDSVGTDPAGVLLDCLARPDSIVSETAIEALLVRAPRDVLCELYAIDAWRSPHEFLLRVAASRGRLKRGGIPDAEAAIKIVITDVAAGRIPFWAEPPVREGVHVSAKLVSSFAPELDLDTPAERQAKLRRAADADAAAVPVGDDDDESDMEDSDKKAEDIAKANALIDSLETHNPITSYEAANAGGAMM